MTKTTSVLVLMAGLAMAVASEAQAQTRPAPASAGFVNISVAAQLQTRNLGTTSTFTLYDEKATLTTSQPIEKGVVFDVSGGYRVWHGVAIGAGYSSFSTTSTASVVATIPHPLYFDQPKTTTTTATDLEHTERGVHLQAVWFVPVNEKIDVALSAGPSFILVTQGLVTSVTVPPGTQNATVVTGTEDGTAIGVNLGLDGTYLFTRNVGLGLMLRYAGGSVDLPSAPGLSVGGFQAGLGLRMRF